MTPAHRVNALRAQRTHLNAQINVQIDTPWGSLVQALELLPRVEAALAEAEAVARELPEAAYLFPRTRGRKKSGGALPLVPTCEESKSEPTTKEATVASKSKAVRLEETLKELRRVEKLAGTTKWALSGAGAAKNPPSPERAAALSAKLEKEQATIAELRAKRDELKGEKKA